MGAFSVGLEYKRIPFELKEVVPTDGGGWQIAGYASTFGGEPDSYGDVVAPGAFAESIAQRATKFLYEHREPIGKQLELREDAHGLFGRWSIVDTALGTDAYKLAKAGVLDSLSIGYMTKESEYDDAGVRVLKKVDLFEVSAVAIPANQAAVITDVKTPDGKATWSASYVNDLPDSSFALVMPGGSKDESGKTTPRSLRKLPHHAADGAIDLPHLRNGLSRAPQMTGVSDAQRSRAVSHLQKHMSAAGKNARHLTHKQYGWYGDETIATFAEGSYEQLAEDLEEAFEAVAIQPGQRGYAEVVATFADRFVAVVTLLGANDMIDPVAAEDPVYYQVPYVANADGSFTLGTAVVVEPETTFKPPDAGQRAAPTSLLAHRLQLVRGRLARHGITVEASS